MVIVIRRARPTDVDEAALTGESMPAARSARAAPGDELDPVPSSCAFMGTIVHQGSARRVVASTGSATSFGGSQWGSARRRPIRRSRSG